MSVLLTSAKKANRPKPKKKKRARVPVVPEHQRPPLSNNEISVWFWDLNGFPTTIYFYKHRNEVWCNGYRLETFEGFEEDGDGEDSMMPGGIIDFTMFQSETQSSYNGRIRRLPVHQVQGYSTHRLTVDDWPIPEHCSYEYLNEAEAYDPSTDDAYLYAHPLRYDD